MPLGEKAPEDPPSPEFEASINGHHLAVLSPQRRAELLAIAEESELVALADRCLQAAPDTRVVESPTVGTIPLCVREPVVGERFILADVLATQAEVTHRGQRGWAMRLGDDATATLAAAICDAEAASGTGLAADVDQLCRQTERRRAEEAAREWAELSRTEVHFQELTQ
jgi:alpha-D-ribose 1-methylphosphonate 5-triphosphate synthase subunit PhnG